MERDDEANINRSDWNSEVAVSSYADMLHDDERNRAYYQAIRGSVARLVKLSRLRSNGTKVFNCCDIGTGSGLLSMMIAQSFLDLNYKHFHVTAFESFIPMAKCAEDVIKSNGKSPYITVLPTWSYAYREGVKFDLLVAELLDTEFIGERCLEAYRFAVTNLCNADCLFVPYKGRIYIEPIVSTTLHRRYRFQERKIQLNERKSITLECPQAATICSGKQQVDDMQVSMLKENEDFQRISAPQVVFEFVLNDLDSLKLFDQSILDFQLTKEVNENLVVVMWWDLVMFQSDEDTSKMFEFDIDLEEISMAPTWARSEKLNARDKLIEELYGRSVWREHWIQGVYYLPSQIDLLGVNEKRKLTVFAYHDNCSMWFDLKPQDDQDCPVYCTCGIHRILSRADLSFLNDGPVMSSLIRSHLVDNQIEVVKAHLRVSPFYIENEPIWIIDYITSSGEVLNKRLCEKGTSIVNPVQRLVTDWSISDASPIDKIEIKFTQVIFDNLHRLRSDVTECEGFKMASLDAMLKQALHESRKLPEPHYLWEYGGRRVDSRDYTLYSTAEDQLSVPVEKLQGLCDGNFRKRYKLPLPIDLLIDDCPSAGWALVFWVEYTLKNTNELISLGPTCSSGCGNQISWTKLSSQLVQFMHDLTPAWSSSTRPESNPDVSIRVRMDGLLEVEVNQ